MTHLSLTEFAPKLDKLFFWISEDMACRTSFSMLFEVGCPFLTVRVVFFTSFLTLEIAVFEILTFGYYAEKTSF